MMTAWDVTNVIENCSKLKRIPVKLDQRKQQTRPAPLRRGSDLELDADLHHLRARNLEIRARPLGVVMHERE